MKAIKYWSIVCDICNGKVEPNQTRLTVGRDKIHYPGDYGTPTAELLTHQHHLHTGGEIHDNRCKNFHLNTPMIRYEHLWLHMSNIPNDVIQHYKLQQKATNDDYIIRKGMYSLLQAGCLEQELLERRLKKHSY